MTQPRSVSVLFLAWLLAGPLSHHSYATEAALVLAEDAVDEGLAAYKIQTPTATWFLEKSGGGLSSLIDRDGNDWLDFHPQPGSGAGGEFRGFPNAVHQQAGNYFHPKNAATDPAKTQVEHVSDDGITISVASSNGQWAGRYDFYATHCTFTMTRMPSDRRYWVLYEGTPGGQYDDDDWWMTSAVRQPQPLTEKHQGDLPAPEWIVFGDRRNDRVLFLLHHQDDEHADAFYAMQQKMTVFGFGRQGIDKFLATVPQQFSIGLLQTADHQKIAAALQQVASTITTVEPAADGADVQPVDSDAGLLRYQQHAMTHDGDAQRGQKLFLDEKRTQCVTCHKVNDRGGAIGPDLSHIGGKFDRAHLIESLLEPSRQIVEGYRSSVIALADGRVESGIVQQQTDRQITLAQVNGQNRVILRSEIEVLRASPVSLMPAGLASALSQAEFTDLIAYLESLRPGGKPKPGGDIIGPIHLPASFQLQTIATGLTGLTAMETTADGRIFVCEQTGALRVVKNGRLLDEPFATLPVEAHWERGLIGVTVHPDFPATPYVYVCYVAKDPYPHHRVSRLTADGDVAVPGSEQVLLAGDDQSKLGGHVPAGHQGGGLRFGNDGKLYIAIGEQTAETPAQQLDSLLGKILRINPDGTIPDDNPLVDQTTGKYQSIWALGLRNPYTFAIQRSTGTMLINDIGGRFEDINRGVAGANYGWPVVDHGPTHDPRFHGPVHHYPHASAVGADFAPDDSAWPAAYHGRYFFADYIHGWIKTLDPQHPERAETFATGLRRPSDLRFAPDGTLYVLLRNAWVMDDKFQPHTGTLLQIRYGGGS